MTDQLIVCHLFCWMLHSVLLSGRLEFEPQPQQILFVRKYSLICSVVSVTVCTGIHEIWHDRRTVEGYTCLHNFNNSVSYNMSIMRISEVEAIWTAFCTWLCNFVAVICGWTLLSRNVHTKLLISVRRQFAVHFWFLRRRRTESQSPATFLGITIHHTTTRRPSSYLHKT